MLAVVMMIMVRRLVLMSIHDNTDDNKNHFFSLMPTYRAGPTHIGQDVREVYVYAGGGEDDNEEEENCNYHYDDGDTGAAVDNNGENFLMKTTLSTPLCIFNGIPPDCDDDTTVCQLSNPSSIQHLSWPFRGSIYQSSLLIIFVVTLRHIFQRLDII